MQQKRHQSGLGVQRKKRRNLTRSICEDFCRSWHQAGPEMIKTISVHEEEEGFSSLGAPPTFLIITAVTVGAILCPQSYSSNITYIDSLNPGNSLEGGCYLLCSPDQKSKAPGR